MLVVHVCNAEDRGTDGAEREDVIQRISASLDCHGIAFEMNDKDKLTPD